MDWSDSPEQAEFRKEVRDFIQKELPQAYRSGEDGGEGFEGGWQADWRRVRARATWTLSGVLIPPSYPDGRPDGVPPELLPDQAGWVFGTTGPGLQVGWVLSEVWSAHAMARPTVTALDTDGRGVRVVPWVTTGAGFDAVF